MFSLPNPISRWWQLRKRPGRRGRSAARPRYLPRLETMEDRTVLSPGALDTTFGMGGKATVSFLPGSNSSRAQGVLVQPDGKLVLAGFAQRSTTDSDFAVARLNANGSLDTGFSATGKSTVSFNLGGGTNAGARAVALQADGKIVVAGFAQRTANNTDFAVARLLANGYLDTGFGSGGKTNFGFGLGSVNDDEATGLVIQPDGKIVVAGFAQRTANDFDFAVARLNADGSLDTSFNGTGKTNFGFSLSSGANKDEAFGVALQPDGKIVLVGFAQTSANGFNFAVARLTAAGALDPAFNGTGKVAVAFNLGGTNDEGFGVALQGDGRIVVAGFAEVGQGHFNFAVARLNTDGSLDAAFGTGGKAHVAFALGGGTLNDDEATALAVQPDGRIVVTGFAQRTADDFDFAIARLTANGSLDPSWNGGGKAVIPFNLGGSNNDRSYAVAVQPDGRVVAVGSAQVSSTSFNVAVTRVEGAPTRFFAIAGLPGRVRLFRPDGSLVADFAPYGPNLRAPISIAFGDVNGDGVMDLITAPLAGNPHVKVYNGAAFANGTFDPNNPDKSLLAQWFAYGLQFNVGANVAAGDVEGDGYADIVTGASAGNPHVKVYRGKDIATATFNPVTSVSAQFFAYGLQFNIGANVAVGPVAGSGYADVVTGAAAGNPHVKVYGGRAIGTGTFNPANADASLLAQFFAYGLQFNIGAFVTVGDANGDGFGDIITGAALGTPHVKVYSGRAIANGTFNNGSPDNSVLNQFFAYDLGQNIGVAVAALENFQGSGQTAILTGARKSPLYRVVAGSATGLKPPALSGLDSFASDIQGPLWVAG
jgi:uncharacterized delta-60 repeat protein